jgi:23S rRNA (uridine2552-2'-O)-methyltransferase
MSVIDLGSAPGGWSQVAIREVGETGRVVAIDLLEMDQIPGVEFIQMDFCHEVQNIHSIVSPGSMDVVLSDIAPNTIGHAATDHLRIMDICARVFDFTTIVLKQDGIMIVKIFQGGAVNTLLSLIKKHFKIVKHVKPNASRKESSEMYMVCIGFKRSQNK